MEINQKITEFISCYDDWRSERLKELREIINSADPELEQDFKWSVPVWTYGGMVCAISAFKDHVKINFFKGASLDDTSKLFNSGLDSKEHRSINFAESDKIDKLAIADLVQQAIKLNSK